MVVSGAGSDNMALTEDLIMTNDYKHNPDKVHIFTMCSSTTIDVLSAGVYIF